MLRQQTLNKSKLMLPNIEQRGFLIQQLVKALRGLIQQHKFKPPIDLTIKCDDTTAFIIIQWKQPLESLLPIKLVSIGKFAITPEKSVCVTCDKMDIFLSPVCVDVESKAQEYKKELSKLKKLIEIKQQKLNNVEFKQRAPLHIINKETDSLTELTRRLKTIELEILELGYNA